MNGKTKKTKWITCVLLLIATTCTAWADSRDDLWVQVYQMIKKGLPQSAITILDQIIPDANEDQAFAETVKAICLKITLEGKIQGGKAEEMIIPLQNEILEAAEPMKPVMETVLAHWYWLYFQQNSYRFIQRTQTAEPPGEDFTTWDLPRILSEIDLHFTLALAAEEELKAIPISEYDFLLEKGTTPDSYRPTLYDFLTNEALSFYTSSIQAGTVPMDVFEFMADSPIFAPADEFILWQPETTNTESGKLKAIYLYQDLLQFHKNDSDKYAFIDADLHRLEFGYNNALGPEKDTLYIASLEQFVNQWINYQIVTRALYKWANVVYNQGDYVQARALAQQGWNLYPDSIGGKWCYNLIQKIEAKSASIQTERVWNDPLPDITVTYRNVTKVYFKIVPFPLEEWIQTDWQYVNSNELPMLLSIQPALAWSEDLPATSDYKQRTEAFPAPAGLKSGTYFLIASHDPSFTKTNNKVSTTPFCVSDLALIVRSYTTRDKIDGFVLNAKSGEPLAGASVTQWVRNNTTYLYEPGDQVFANENGIFNFPYNGSNTQYFKIAAEYGGQKILSESSYSTRNPSSSSTVSQQTIFFTDKSLYRPGQTIRYKGICIQFGKIRGTTTDTYNTMRGTQLTVIFRDAIGQEIARQQHVSNDYGSFSGSFIAPRDRLTGQMSISVYGGWRSGSISFNVEEYKRPKFRVEFEPPTESPRLNTEVEVPGKATAFTGAAIGGAKVTWRVVRQVRFPVWCWRAAYRYPSLQEQAIACGSTTTEANGTFSIEFTAKPDLSILEEDEPVFEYRINADVTDTTGETRSAQSIIHAGYTALQADIQANEWQTSDKPVYLTITTSSLDGVGESAQGTVDIYSLIQPEKVIRAPLGSSSSDESIPDTWELDSLISQNTFQTNVLGITILPVTLNTGIYRAILHTQDRFGKPVSAQYTIQVVDPEAAHFDVRLPSYFSAPEWSVEPGQTFEALWGTGYNTGRAYIELECKGQLLRSWWTDPSRTQELILQNVTEDMRGGFTLRVTFVCENRAYINQKIIDVPWTNKQLKIQWEHFTSLLEPGENETWTAIITGSDTTKAIAEMVAGLYDASLDLYLPHDWIHAFTGFRSESSRLTSTFENRLLILNSVLSDWGINQLNATLSYRHFPDEIIYPPFRYAYWGGGAMSGGGGYSDGSKNTESVLESLPTPNLDSIPTRSNFDETAFFYPHLISDSDGTVKIEFTMPETLTEWRFLGFAHDNQLRSGYISSTTVTAKDLMVTPNPPRFVREGDTIEFTVKVTNQSATRQTGTVRLTLTDAYSIESRDAEVNNVSPEQIFDVPSMESRTYSWRLSIPDDCDFLTYKAVAATTRLSDGEEGYLPVLSRRILVAESLPLPVRGAQTKEFEFTSLLNSGQSQTLRHQSLTVQMVSQPAWYAIMALPYLMEYPYNCSEQIFNRLYANSLASYIANSDPQIRHVFDMWKATPALDSPLEKNEDLKMVALEETPWVIQAMNESQARKNVGILFDENRLNSEISLALFKLEQMQLSSGLWPWFPGCRGNEYVTLYIVTGFGRLRHLSVSQIDVSSAVKALDALDKWMDEEYKWILAHGDINQDNLSPTIVFYLYGRSFFLSDQPIDAEYQQALNFWLDQARTYWLSLFRQSQAHIALALKRFGDLVTPLEIMQSIKEHSVTDEELGMYWRDTERSWWWYRAPIETQALMIEAFDEVTGDAQAVEDCRVWLLKQKQTQNWGTTKATADTIYALLLREVDYLASHALVEVALDGVWIDPHNIEAGTGFYEERFVKNEIDPNMGHITVRKTDDGVSWGSVHWQYLEDVGKVEPYDGTPLQLTKNIFIKKTNEQGQLELYPVEGPVSVGDELVVRIELRADRDMEYVHLKDQRGSGTEPVDVLSGYRFQDGLAYYESVRDTATHFFMDYLPKGTYVFEYSTRIQLKGKYQIGIAAIQCMYAPEFNSHSQSYELDVE